MNLLMNPIVLHVEEFQAEFQISDGLYYAETICFCKKKSKVDQQSFCTIRTIIVESAIKRTNFPLLPIRGLIRTGAAGAFAPSKI